MAPRTSSDLENLPNIILPDHLTGGQRRFACQCGAHLYEGWEGVMHAFGGHEVVIETFRGGRWVYDRNPLMKQAIDKMRRKGESQSDFAKRIVRWMDEVNRQVEIIARERMEAAIHDD